MPTPWLDKPPRCVRFGARIVRRYAFKPYRFTAYFNRVDHLAPCRQAVVGRCTSGFRHGYLAGVYSHSGRLSPASNSSSDSRRRIKCT